MGVYSPAIRASLSLIICSIFAAAQPIRLSITGKNDSPRSVSLYSTLGGTSANTSRCTKPSSSKMRSVWVSDFCEMSGNSRCSCLKRKGSLCCSVYSTRSDHLSPTRANILRIGQLGNNASLACLLFSF